jgi:hypothetical protein
VAAVPIASQTRIKKILEWWVRDLEQKLCHLVLPALKNLTLMKLKQLSKDETDIIFCMTN